MANRRTAYSGRPIKINVVSESEFTVKGHGVHTAFRETVKSLQDLPFVTLLTNSNEPADIIHIHTIGTFALRHLLFGKGKKVVSAHIVPDSLVGSLVLAKYWRGIAKLYLRWFYNRADLVFAVSDSTRHELECMGVKKPIRVLYNTISLAPYSSKTGRAKVRKKLEVHNDSFVVIGVGQTQPRKRIDTFLTVADKMPEVEFVWVGGMPFGKLAAEHAEIVRAVKHAPKNVHFPGIVELEEMPQWYAASDAFLFPSYQETFGLAIVEAAASDLPVILRDIPDYDNTFRGHAIMASRDEEFVEAIRKLKNDAKFYDDAVRQTRMIAKRFDSAKGAETLVGFYYSVLDGIID